MATSRVFSLSRTLFTTTITKKSLLPFCATSSSPCTVFPLSRSSFLPSLRPITAVGFRGFVPAAASSGAFRSFATRQSQTSLNDNSPNWSNRPPKETILLDGCDFEHWLVVTEPFPEGATRDEIIDSYIKTLAQVIGSEEEARMKIYSVSTRCYFAFGALVSEELSYKLKELPNVRWVLPDSYLDVKNKDYGGEPFINGQAVPYDPKYHEEWIRNNQKAMERNRRNDRPRNADRSRNFERRQRSQGAYAGGPGGQPGGPPNMGSMPNQHGSAPNNVGYGHSVQPSNAGYEQNRPPNTAGYGQNMPPNNVGFGQNMPQNNPGFGQNMPQNNPGFGQNNPGYGQNMPQNNPTFVNAPNRGGMQPPNFGGQGNPGYQTTMPNHQGGGMPFQNTQMPNPQSNYAPQGNMGGQPGAGYQPQDVPGRDMPQ